MFTDPTSRPCSSQPQTFRPAASAVCCGKKIDKNKKNTLRTFQPALYPQRIAPQTRLKNLKNLQALELMKTTKFSHSIQLTKSAALALAAAAVLAPAVQAGYILTNSLVVNGTLFMDEGTSLVSANVAGVAANGLIVQAPNNGAHLTNITNIRGWLNSGFNGGLWNGTGIASATAALDAGTNGVLAVMLYDNTLLNYDDFAGATGLLAPFEQVFTRVTYFGDYDASGVVDATDYGILDAYLGGGFLAQGDINADAAIDSSDYGILDAVLGSQPYGNLTSIGSSFSGGAGKSGGVVPEPASAILLVSGAVGLLGMRRRK